MHTNSFDFSREHGHKKKGQPADMVKMCMSQKDIQSVGLQVLLNAKESSAGVQGKTDLGQQQTGRVSPFVRMIATGSKKNESHESSSS